MIFNSVIHMFMHVFNSQKLLTLFHILPCPLQINYVLIQIKKVPIFLFEETTQPNQIRKNGSIKNKNSSNLQKFTIDNRNLYAIKL